VLAPLQREFAGLVVLGPAPAPLERLKTLWRAHLLVKSQSPSELNRAVQALLPLKGLDDRIRLTLDVDPQEML
jgi:primosomal protein N' (replication factor Y)